MPFLVSKSLLNRESIFKAVNALTIQSGESLTCIHNAGDISHNESHVCDVAPSPTRARGHVAERRAAAPRSPSRPAGAAMYIRAVMCRCANYINEKLMDSLS